jgi:hypothetical protein
MVESVPILDTSDVLYEPLGLATVEIISPSRDVQAGEAAVIVATIDVNKAG